MGVGLYGDALPILEESFIPTAGGGVTAWRFVDDFGNNLASAGARASGVAAPFDTLSATDVTNKRALRVLTMGCPVIELGGTVTAGDPLTSDSVGRAIKWTPGLGSYINGVARESGVSGDRIRMYFYGQRQALPSGQAVLVAGTVTVATPLVAAASIIHLTRAIAGGTVGDLRLGAIVAGTSFVINSAGGADTSTINWSIAA